MTLMREPIARTLDNFVELALRGTKKERRLESLLSRILYSPRMKELISEHHADAEIYLQSKIRKELSEQLTDAVKEDKKYITALLKTAKKIPTSKEVLACHERFTADMGDYITLMQNIRSPDAVLQAAETLNLPDCEATWAYAKPAFKIYLLVMRVAINERAEKMILYPELVDGFKENFEVRAKYKAGGKWHKMMPVPYQLAGAVYTKIKAEAGMRPVTVKKTTSGEIHHVIFNPRRKSYDFSVKVESATPYERITITRR
jgi:hypothetical protein